MNLRNSPLVRGLISHVCIGGASIALQPTMCENRVLKARHIATDDPWDVWNHIVGIASPNGPDKATRHGGFWLLQPT